MNREQNVRGAQLVCVCSTFSASYKSANKYLSEIFYSIVKNNISQKSKIKFKNKKKFINLIF
jgi:hypothetical protein